MRLVKEDIIEFTPFYESLEKVATEKKKASKDTKLKTAEARNLPEQMNYLFKLLVNLRSEIESVSTIAQLKIKLVETLKKLVPLKLADIFFFDENLSNLVSATNAEDDTLTSEINNFYRNGILDWIFSTGKPQIIPENKHSINENPKFNYFVFPIIEEGKRKGVLAIYSPTLNRDLTQLDLNTIELVLSLLTGKLEKLSMREKINALYFDLQTYQAKVANDNRLTAIGQFAEGMIEDILNPLQVIISNIGLMEEKVGKESVQKIKNQVSKIKNLIERLIKFATIDEKKVDVVPCDLNKLIDEFQNVVSPSLKNLNIETIIDLDKNLPPILSHPSYIYQMLSNILSFMKPINSGGILIQTRSSDDTVQLKFISTKIVEFENSQNEQLSITLRIIKNLITKNEGDLFYESFGGSGTVILLHFPIRRKIRK